MSTARAADFSLAQAVCSPAFTPRQDDAAPLVELFVALELSSESPPDDRPSAPRAAAKAVTPAAVVTALARIGPRALLQTQARLAATTDATATTGAARAALVRLGGLLLGLHCKQAEISDAQLHWLVALTADSDRKAARQAVIALGKLPLPGRAQAVVEAALLSRWDALVQPADRRAIAESLGKLGGAATVARLRAAEASGELTDPLLAQTVSRALLRIDRTVGRQDQSADDAPQLVESGVRGDVALPAPTAIALRCRAGLANVLLDELRGRKLLSIADSRVVEPGDPRASDRPGSVEFCTRGPLDRLFQARTFMDLAFPLAVKAGSAGSLTERVVEALTRPATLSLLQTLTRGPLRYRLHFTGGGHRRSLVWDIATAVSARCPELKNDPTHSPWQVEIDDRDSAAPRLWLLPRQLSDPRFRYRVGAVPAASEPTLAAALARLCAARESDVVWDPFAGSGAELIELALLGGCRNLYGSDRDEAAIAIAQRNCEAAGVRGVRLSVADAIGGLTPPGPITRILTNPPMGRRVRAGDLATLLRQFVGRAGRLLGPGGKLVWISPLPRETAAVAEACGLHLELCEPVDMNGFTARLEVWQRPAVRR